MKLLVSALVFVISCTGTIKEPSVAGSFYPQDRKALQNAIDGYLSNAQEVQTDGRLVALISPHAGYMFSGQVAAYGYKNLKNAKTVILIGPSHHEAFKGAAIFTEGAFRTPLGDVSIDSAKARSLLSTENHIIEFPKAFEKEHSLEVQLPFLQTTLKGFKIVPILISMPTREMYMHLSDKLTKMLTDDKDAIIVASSDLSHYHDYETANKMDSMLINAISTMSHMEAERLVIEKKAEMCGAYAVLLAIDVASNLGANKSITYKYANSGDITGSHNRVVGYSSIGLISSPLSESDKKALLSIARVAILQKIKEGEAKPIATDNPKLKSYGAAFVTIKRGGLLRGCVGHVKPVMSLIQSIWQNAVAASSYDRRFPPMSVHELDDMELEISVLIGFRPISNTSDIEVGRHGIYLRSGQNAGLLLPQVAVENKWDRETFLRQASIKAGLSQDAYKTSDLYVFEANVFGDNGGI